MGYVADAGYGGTGSTYGLTVPLETEFAEGNLSGPSSVFTSEKIAGADREFSSSNVAPAFPVTRVSPVVHYAENGISGAPAKLSFHRRWR